MKKRILSALLATMMLVSCLAACGGGKEGDSTTAATTTAQGAVDATASQTPAETEPPEPTLGEVLGFAQTDYEQYEFHMLIAGTDEYEHLAESLTGDIVNDAVYARNTQVEEFFNIDLQIVSKPCDWGDKQTFTDEVSNQVLAGDPTWDMVVGQTAVMAWAITTQYYLDIADMPGMDLSKSWWVANQYDTLQINDKLLFAFGDMNLSLYGDTHGILFNSTIINENKLENPYELVKNNQWTLDKMLTMAEQAGGELDGEAGVSAAGDRIGLISYVNPMRAMLTSLGCEVLVRGEDGGISMLSALPEKHVDAYAKLSNAFTDGMYNAKLKHTNDSYDEGMTMLANDRALFLPCYLSFISNAILRDMTGDFGIVPYPKYDENQENYISQIATGATCTTFPQNIAKPELSAQVANYMGYLGKTSLVSTYYETYLQERLSRSPEMQEMLTLIRDTATMKLGVAYATLFSPNLLNWNEVSYAVDHGSTLVSKYKANAAPGAKIVTTKILPRFE